MYLCVYNDRKNNANTYVYTNHFGESNRSALRIRIYILISMSEVYCYRMPLNFFLSAIYLSILSIYPNNTREAKKKRTECCGVLWVLIVRSVVLETETVYWIHQIIRSHKPLIDIAFVLYSRLQHITICEAANSQPQKDEKIEEFYITKSQLCQFDVDALKLQAIITHFAPKTVKWMKRSRSNQPTA